MLRVRILVIDDDEDLLFLAQQFLTAQDSDFRLLQTSTALDALRILDEEDFDAVICDFYLGPEEMNGLQILEWLRERGCNTPFIIFTGRSREEVAIQALNLGADYYLEKGEDLEGLFTEIGHHVKSVVRSRRTEEALHESEQRYRTLVQSMSDLIFVIDARDHFSQYHSIVETDLFPEPADFLEKHISEVVPPQISEPYLRLAGDVRLDGVRKSFDYEICLKGEIRWYSADLDLHEDGESIVVSIAEITDRKRIENELRNAEREWRNTFDSIPDFVSVLNNEFQILSGNKTMAGALGVNPEELVGKKCYEVMHKTAEPFPGCPHLETAKSGLPATAEIHDPCLKAPYLITTSPLMSEDGEQIGVVHIAKDISDRVEAEAAIRASESKFKTLFEHAGIGMALVKGGELLETNGALQEFLGYDADELAGMTIDQISHPLDRGKDAAELQRIIDTGEDRYQMEKRYIRKAGETVWGRLTVSLIRDVGGIPQYTIGMVENITEQKETELLLDEERNRASTYLNLAGTLILATDTNLHITMINETGCKILGLPEEEILGKNWIEYFIPQTHKKEIRDYMLGIIAGEFEPSTANEGPIIDASGRIRWIQWTDVVVREKDGKVIGTLSAGPDITEKKHAEEERRASDERYRLIFDYAPIGVSHSNMEGDIFRANSALEDMLGYKADEFAQMKVEALTHPDDWEVEIGLNQELLEGTRDSYTLEKRFFHKNGQIVWGRLNVSIKRDEEGKPEFVIGMAEDITRQKQAEESFRAVFEHAGIGMTIVDKTDYIIEANLAYQKMVGYNLQELRRMKIAEFTHPDDAMIDAALFNEVLEGKRESYQMIKRYITKNGNMIWVSLTVSVVTDEAGNITFIVGMVEDITSRMDAEEALKESEEKYRALVDNVQSGIHIAQDGISVYANEILANMLGYEIDEIVGSPFTNMIAPEDLDWIKDRYNRRISGESVPSEYDVRLLHKNGSRKFAHLKVANFIFGGKLSTIATVTDITESRMAENELREGEQRYRLLYENLADGLFITNPQGIITMCSPQGAMIYGGTPEEITGTHFSIYVHPDERNRIMDKFKMGIENQVTKPVGFEVKGIRKDGSDFYYHITNTLLLENGEVTGYQSLIRDITEFKKIEDALRDSELRYRQIVESTPIGMHMYELDNNDRLIFIGANPAADKLLGLDHSQFTGKTLEDAFPAAANTEIPRKYKEVALTGEAWSSEQVDYQDDRIAGAFEVHAFQATPRTMVASFFDVSHRKATEHALEKQTNELRQRVKEQTCLYDALKLLDSAGKIETVFQKLVEIIKGGWQFPDIANVRVFYKGQEYKATPFRESPWKQTADIVVSNEKVGEIQIYYTEERATLDEGPFLIEERQLIDALAENLSSFILRKNAEDELIRQKEFTETALNAQRDTFFVFEPASGKAVRWNKAFREISGYTDEEIASMKAPSSYYSPEELETAEIIIENLMNGATEIVELALITKDGKSIPFEYMASTIPDENGQPKYIVSVGRSIEERRLAEGKIEEHVSFLENVLEALSHPFYVIDTNNFRIALANKAARLGPLSESSTCHSVTHRNDKPCFNTDHPCPLEEVKRTKKPAVVEHTHFDEDGGLREMEIHAYPIMDGSGDVVQMIEYALDVTEHKKTVRALADSEKRFRELYENAPLGYQTLDRSATILNVNQEWLNALGYTRDEVVGQHFGRFLTAESKRALSENFEKFRNDGSISDVEYELICKDGSHLIARFNGRIALDEKGDFKQTHCIFQDITEWKLTDDLLRRQKEELSELAHVMSHDLGNKMRNIQNLVKLLRREYDESVLERIDSIAHQSSHLLHASADLADAGMVVQKRELVDLNEVIKEIGATTIPDNIALTVDKLPIVRGSSEKIGQIFQNLFANAVEHAIPKEIKVCTETSDMGTWLIVSNDGAPIPKDIQEKIFRRGFTTKEKGTGLGLSIVKKLVEAHGWRIQLGPEDQTTFRILLRPYH